MCGIAGIFMSNGEGIRDSGLIRKMAATLRHRGPDEEGYYTEGPVALGHRRLSIIDLDGGRQPIFNEDGTMAIVFNGEVYNFRDLQRELEAKGHRFRTRSDTEAILHAYEEYGEECVCHLRGMFAFAIWDGKGNRLFVARDRIGIKPLYYCWDGSKFLFGSEIKAILADPTVAKDIDPFAIDDFLTYLYIPAPKSIFRSIRKLRPGWFLTVSAGSMKEQKYWDISFEPKEERNDGDYVLGLLEQLKESVSVHLMSEVPLGAFLSGGIDSSAVVGVMAGMSGTPVNTASIGFREAGFNELPFARIVAGKFHTNAYEKIVEADAAAILDDLTLYFDEPFGDSSMVPTYYVSQVARERVKVCLSGDGGDENFAGYRRYRFDAFENRVRAIIPGMLRRPLFHFLGLAYPKADWLPQVFRAKTLFTNLSLSPERGYFHSMSWFTPDMKERLYLDSLKGQLSGYDPYSVMEEHFDAGSGLDPLSRIQYVDIKTYLSDDILVKVDRASMAHSLEVRVPLLDHKFMEYAAGIPPRLKLRGGEGKYVFKKALEPILPPEILYRKKMGFSIPLADWFRKELKGLFEARVLGAGTFTETLFHPASIRRLWDQHQRGTRDFSYYLWAILVLECWGRKYLTP